MSALDARMRLIATEVHAELVKGLSAKDGDTERVAELEKQVADLAVRLDTLEKASAPAKRAARKTATETSE